MAHFDLTKFSDAEDRAVVSGYIRRVSTELTKENANPINAIIPNHILEQCYLFYHQEDMDIYIKTLNGSKHPVTVNTVATVKEVKLRMKELDGIPENIYYQPILLIFKGKILNDTDILKDRGTFINSHPNVVYTMSNVGNIANQHNV